MISVCPTFKKFLSQLGAEAHFEEGAAGSGKNRSRKRNDREIGSAYRKSSGRARASAKKRRAAATYKILYLLRT